MKEEKVLYPKLYSFHTGTDGMRRHSEFIDYLSRNGLEIVNAYVLYHSYNSSHKPAYLNYVIQPQKI